MTVLTSESTVDEIAANILSNKVMWFLYNDRYKQVFAFEDAENSLTIYFFADDGTVASHRFGGES